jgi:hypothetical protein
MLPPSPSARNRKEQLPLRRLDGENLQRTLDGLAHDPVSGRLHSSFLRAMRDYWLGASSCAAFLQGDRPLLFDLAVRVLAVDPL